MNEPLHPIVSNPKTQATACRESIQSVIAASAEIRGEHIALLNSKGKPAALFSTGSSKAGPVLLSLTGSAPGKLQANCLALSNGR
jgi:hypothetical protein